MHNKLLVADNAVALIGGRNIGNQYFQMDPESQFADDDVFAAGPIAAQLSATFDEYWNSRFADPGRGSGTQATVRDCASGSSRASERAPGQQLQTLKAERRRLRQTDCDRRALCRNHLRPVAAGVGARASGLRQPRQEACGEWRPGGPADDPARGAMPPAQCSPSC